MKYFLVQSYHDFYSGPGIEIRSYEGDNLPENETYRDATNITDSFYFATHEEARAKVQDLLKQWHPTKPSMHDKVGGML
jgi:hypothetical protein